MTTKFRRDDGPLARDDPAEAADPGGGYKRTARLEKDPIRKKWGIFTNTQENESQAFGSV